MMMMMGSLTHNQDHPRSPMSTLLPKDNRRMLKEKFWPGPRRRFKSRQWRKVNQAHQLVLQPPDSSQATAAVHQVDVGGAHHHDSALDTRALVDARVIEYLNQNRGDTKENNLLKSLGPYMQRVPEERQERCIAAMANLLFSFSSPPDPHEVELFLERYRDNILSGRRASHTTVTQPPPGIFYPSSGPSYPQAPSYEPRRQPSASLGSSGFNPVPFTRDLFDL